MQFVFWFVVAVLAVMAIGGLSAGSAVDFVLTIIVIGVVAVVGFGIFVLSGGLEAVERAGMNAELRKHEDQMEIEYRAARQRHQAMVEEFFETQWKDLTSAFSNQAVPDDLQRSYQTVLEQAAAMNEEYFAPTRLQSNGQLTSAESLGQLTQPPLPIQKYFRDTLIPLIQKAHRDAGAQVLGTATWPEVRPVLIQQDLRFQHTYIIGATGTGKTTLLKNLILADIKSGQGLTVISPDKSFVTDQLIPCLDPSRVNDVIYFNPEDSERPVTFNPLDLQPYENIDRKADELLTLFKRSIGETSPRMDAILRNSFYALLERKGSTLVDMYELLLPTTTKLRNKIISTTQDPMTKQFFEHEYPSYPKDAARPILNRLDQLTRPVFLRNALCQPKSTLNFHTAMNERRVILCNLSDGAMGTQNATLLGQLLIAAIQQALFARDTISEVQRIPHYLYIDEFETYTTASTTALSEILARARKLKFGIAIAHQHLKQIPTDLLAGILGNTSTKVVFRVAPEDAKKLVPHILPSAASDSVLAHDLPQYKLGHAFVRVGSASFQLETIPDSHFQDSGRFTTVIEESRRNYGQTPQTRPLAQTEKPAYNEDESKQKQPQKEESFYE